MSDLPVAATPPPPPPPSAAPPPAPPAEKFHLLRSRDGRLGGVAAGLAAAAGIDVTVARIAVALGALTGIGLLAYIVAWAAIPKEDPANGLVLRPAPDGVARGLRTGLIVLAAVGGLRFLGGLIGIALFPITVLTGIFGDAVHFDSGGGDGPGWRATVGLVLVAVGVVALLRRRSSSGWAGAAGPVGGSGGAPGGPPSGSGGAAWGPPPPGGPSFGGPSFGGPSFGGPAGGPPDAPESPATRWEKRLLAARALGWLFLLWFLAGTGAGAVLWLTGGLDVRLPALVIITSVAAIGAAGTVLVRDRRPAVVLLGTAALIIPAVLGGVLTRWEGETGSRTIRPEQASELQSRYRHLFGELDLDLSALDLDPGSRQVIEARIAVGRLAVTVPLNARVTVSGRVGAGVVDLFGTENRGTGVRAVRTSQGEGDGPLIELRLRAGVGVVEVSRHVSFTRDAINSGSFVPMQCRQGGVTTCQAYDRYPTPELNCLVQAGDTDAICKTLDSTLEFDQSSVVQEGARLCRVPAGGGVAACGPPAPAPPEPPAAPAPTMVCTIPAGGGTAQCRPEGAEASPPADTTPTTVAVADYLCVTREDGTAECRPA